MGWGPCGHALGHWYSVRERGTAFAFWNISHNVGGGITGIIAAYSTSFLGWRYAFFIPGVLAVLCAFYLVFRLRDTPQSEGLPPIEEYKDDYPPEETESHERELGTREFLVWGIGLSLGGPTGYAINPARDLGPRLAYAVLPIVGKGTGDWGYFWIPVIAPIIGGIIGAALFTVLGF